jgi:hypothetical protein
MYKTIIVVSCFLLHEKIRNIHDSNPCMVLERETIRDIYLLGRVFRAADIQKFTFISPPFSPGTPEVLPQKEKGNLGQNVAHREKCGNRRGGGFRVNRQKMRYLVMCFILF